MNLPLQNIAEISMGYPFRSRLERDRTADVAVIQMKDIDEANLVRTEDLDRTSIPNFKDHYLIRANDLIFRSRGQTNTVALVAADPGRAVLAAPMMMIRVTTPKVLPAYLNWFINQPTTQARLTRVLEGTSVKMISKATLEKLEVSVPSVQKQRYVIELAALSSKEQQLMRELNQLRKTYIEGILMHYAQDARREPGKGGGRSA